MCGEYKPGIAHDWIVKGSPPHVWGIQKMTEAKYPWVGITPTCVGNTRLNTIHP